MSRYPDGCTQRDIDNYFGREMGGFLTVSEYNDLVETRDKCKERIEELYQKDEKEQSLTEKEWDEIYILEQRVESIEDDLEIDDEYDPEYAALLQRADDIVNEFLGK